MFEWNSKEINSLLKDVGDGLNIWRKVFPSLIKNEGKNISFNFKMLLITLITNAKLEQMFRCMLRVKTDWRNIG